MFPIVAEKYKFVVGVDTHAQKHVAAVMTSQGLVVATREIRVTGPQLNGFIAWIRKVTDGIDDVLLAVEGTSSYGETLTKLALASGLAVTEVKPPRTKARGGSGKTDLIDAELAARSVLHLTIDKLITPRVGNTRKSLRILLMQRRSVATQQTAEKNALTALLRGCDLGVDARRSLAAEQFRKMSLWKTHAGDDQEQAIARYEAKRLAISILGARPLLDQNEAQLAGLVNTLAPGFLDTPGIGPITAAQVICSYSHKGRVRSAAAFAALAGTAPIPASSGNVTRHRLSRFGDRDLNSAIHTIALSRMRYDDTTKAYVERRTAEGRSRREVRRSLKLYIARALFKKLETFDIST